MKSSFSGSKIVLATHNQGKLIEIRDVLSVLSIEVVSAGDLGLPEPEETGTTFEENAALKAHAAAQASGLPALADDSGLAVTALKGAPGVYSARWAKTATGEQDFAYAMQRVLKEVASSGSDPDTIDRRAAFVCVMALAWPDGSIEMRRGDCMGTILPAPQGEAGFGYDPIFAPTQETRSFAQMSLQEKRTLSHRGKALKLMVDEVFA